MTLQLAVRRVLEDLGFERKYDPTQPRRPDGTWGEGVGLPDVKPVDRKADKLKLDGRIKLGPGERLVASGEAKQASSSEVAMPIAVISTPDGPQVRLGVSTEDDSLDIDDDGEVIEGSGKGWSGNDPASTVRLEAAGIEQLRNAFARENAAAKERQKQILADWDRMEELEGDSDPGAQAELAGLKAKHAGAYDDVIGQGVIPGLPGGGGLAYQVSGTEDGTAGWEYAFAVKPADAGAEWTFAGATEDNYLAGRMEPKHVAAYQKHIAAMVAKAGDDSRSNLQHVVRHLPGKHNQENHGDKGGGTTLSRKDDPLALDGRIKLAAGEKLRASDRVRTNNGGDGDTVLAGIAGPDGPQMRVGVLPSQDATKWRGSEGGATARFDGDDVQRVAAELASMADAAKRARAEFRATGAQLDSEGVWDDDDANLTADQLKRRTAYEAMREDGVFAEGVIPGSGWGDIHWTVRGEDAGDPGEEEVLISALVRPSDERDMSWNDMRDSVTGSWFPALYDVSGAARLAKSAAKVATAASTSKEAT